VRSAGPRPPGGNMSRSPPGIRSSGAGALRVYHSAREVGRWMNLASSQHGAPHRPTW
jgi:hypothetical protein